MDNMASHWSEQPEVGSNFEPKILNEKFADVNRERRKTLTLNALKEVPLFKNVPQEVIVLVTELSEGYIQTCWGCKSERSCDRGNCLTFHCDSCKRVEDLYEELEAEQAHEVYYDDGGNMMPQSWFNYSDSDYCDDSYVEFRSW